MKSKWFTLLAVLMVAVLLTPAASVGAKNEKTYFTVDNEFCESGIPERFLFVGQGNYIAFNMPTTCWETGSIPEVTGVTYVELTNYHALANGIWMFVGTGRMVTDDGGVWNMNCVYQWPSPDAQCHGNGEGIYDGMQIFMTGVPGYLWNGYIVDR